MPSASIALIELGLVCTEYSGPVEILEAEEPSEAGRGLVADHRD